MTPGRRGVGKATRQGPHPDIMNAPWWTDGFRTVIEVPDVPNPMDQIEFFYWDWSDEDAEAFNEQLRRLSE